MAKQVDKTHYNFHTYQSDARFSSIYHQIDAAIRLKPDCILEIGAGSGFFKALVVSMNYHYISMDIDNDLYPDVLASAVDMPFTSNSIDVVAAFQVLEHMPFELFEKAVSEMYRVCRKGVAISLPDVGNFSIIINIPFIRRLSFILDNIVPVRTVHDFDGEHYWEINKKNYELKKIIDVFTKRGFLLEKTWVNPHWAYHRFFVFKK